MTPHNEAKKGEIAKTVLMPGDPLRAKYIAEKYLENPKLVNNIRGMYAYTGTYKGKEITVMGSGMGIPSIGIYAYELYKIYDVDEIIRIGSAGANSKDLDLLDIVLSDEAYSDSAFAKEFNNEDIHLAKPSLELNNKIIAKANELDIKINVGMTNSGDVFDAYVPKAEEYLNHLPKEVIASEMEAFALFYLANLLNKKAACLMTIVDSKFTEKKVSAEERQTSLDNMIKLALEVIK